ncbi:PIG-L deacetylase family protein [Spartinivicinus poritis]|uniref:PIG-L family deacetylase n=1 Tax=Spartinivicinus poritis TaxID=2994640 RepID=A0ABT5U6F0_9GAMM|nr:PIG-L family deacetylase [Spartinivicinus sp. A2-2]MDE1461930.1 PIG-L family deacetylase [Spartinivicinus sp. A2-2]
MKTKDNPYLKKKKMTNQIKALVFICLALLGLLMGWYWQTLLFAVIFYIAHEVLWSDHIFYDPKSDYQYQFENAVELPLTIENNQLRCVEKPDSELSLDTGLVIIKIKANWLGSIFDPYVEISDGNTTNRQYFERSANGLRYLNISDWLKTLLTGEYLTLNFKHCQPIVDNNSKSALFGFANPDIINKRIMIIAPHADDAELAAFGLYSQAEEVSIITLTAGEVEQKDFQHVYPDPQQASILKGRLRAFDSIAVPAWGGVPKAQVVNLGYFCLRLKDMYEEQTRLVSSKTAGVDTTTVFREFNSFPLPTDGDNKATGENLLKDLHFLIEKYQPEVIVTPHLELDPHQDHYYATQFIHQAVSEVSYSGIKHWLYYANHYVHTDMHPFGPPHAIASLAPNLNAEVKTPGVLSIPLSEKQQKDKVYALEMMHDLKRKTKLKKYFRGGLQNIFVNRSMCKYGEDSYFFKCIKSNELFVIK